MSGDGFDVEEFLDELGVRQEVQDLIDIDNAAAIRGGGTVLALSKNQYTN